MRRLTSIMLMSLLALGSAGPVLAKQTPHIVSTPTVAATHGATGVQFPSKLGEFSFFGAHDYAPDDTSYRYQLAPGNVGIVGQPWVDLYVYPRWSPSVSQSQIILEGQIENAFQNVHWLRALDPPKSAPDALGRLAKADARGDAVETAYIIRQFGNWEVKMRVTCVGCFNEESWAKVQVLIDAFAWGPIV